MSEKIFDVAIIGGGPTGSALALLLARICADPSRIALIQADHTTHYGRAPAQDPRVLAVNHGSRVLLESLVGWPAQAAEIHTIHVSQRGRLGRCLIKREDFGVQQLGCVLGYAALHASLSAAVQASGVTVLHGKARQSTNGTLNSNICIQVGQELHQAKLLVQADGISDSDVARDYQQMAIIAYARASAPKPGWAYERFTNEGPLAVLPHPASPALQSIVWCCSPARARRLQSLSLSEFSNALTQAFGARLGHLSVEDPLALFPLALSMKKNIVNARLVAIGNAAQTMHPVAGQGLNLGLRDAACLAQSLAPWLSGLTEAPEEGLKDYVSRRGPDRQLTVHLTDIMSRFFTSGIPLVEHAAGLGLLSLDLVPSLRKPLTRHLLQGLRR